MKPSRDASGVWRVFDGIARRYDTVNTVLSMGHDRTWRRRLADYVCDGRSKDVLDVATGTGEILMSLSRHAQSPSLLVGVDMAIEMLGVARAKTYGVRCRFARGDALRLPFADGCFDVVTIAFGIRNVSEPAGALREFRRVLRPGGCLAVLEFSLPTNRLFRGVYLPYFRHVLPLLGGWLTGDREAYRYLNATVETFPFGDAFCKIIAEARFDGVRARPMSGGIATLYTASRSQV